MATEPFDAVVIGGGFYGCEIAAWLSTRFSSVAIVEKEGDIMRRASYANQARVHAGYHYPRSIMTALRTRMNFPRFVKDYADGIVEGNRMYYAVSKQNSNVTAAQFRLFMERIGALVSPAPKDVSSLFEPALIEEVYAVNEAVFDAEALAELVRGKLKGVELLTDTTVTRVRDAGGTIEIDCLSGDTTKTISAPQVFNCTYSRINTLLAASDLPLIPLKHEVAELALVRPPEQLADTGITVMCGPFFSLMPFPPRQAHTLSHVRYTPHHEWRDGADPIEPHAHLAAYKKTSAYPHMIRDAVRYMPMLAKSDYLGESIWEVKTVLQQSENDDSRPILLKTDHGLKGFHCILGAKIDNIYDVLEELEKRLFLPIYSQKTTTFSSPS